MKIILIFLILFLSRSFSQIVFTAVDAEKNDVRACYYNNKTDEVIEISSNNSYLPNWLGDNIIYNFGNHVWKTDINLSDENILFEGVKAVVSPNNKYIAAYYKNGIVIADSNGKSLKKIELEIWDRVTITFSNDGSFFTYYDKPKESCNIFDWKNETIKKLGSHIYHPQWSKQGRKILINIGKLDENFRVGLIDTNYQDGNEIFYISEFRENAIIPIWSPKENYIAYMTLDDKNKNEYSDLHSGSVYLYKTFDGRKILIDNFAGYTESAYPQFCFDKEENYFYYNSVNQFGKGTIIRVDIKNNFKKEKLTKKDNIDYRIPKCKK